MVSNIVTSVEGSLFARVLYNLMIETDIFHKEEWAQLLMVKEVTIDKWLSDMDIPRPLQLHMIYLVLEKDDNAIDAINYFTMMSQLSAKTVSPLGKLMLPNVWEYMTRLAFCDVSSKLAKMNTREEKEKFLEEIYK